MPVAAVCAEGWTERAELEPANVQLARVFFGRNESADIASPIRKSRKAAVDRNRHVCGERLPPAPRVARPDVATVTLNAGRGIAVQRERPLVRAIELGSLPVHPMPIQTRRPIETITLIGPPTVRADIHQRLV